MWLWIVTLNFRMENLPLCKKGFPFGWPRTNMYLEKCDPILMFSCRGILGTIISCPEKIFLSTPTNCTYWYYNLSHWGTWMVEILCDNHSPRNSIQKLLLFLSFRKRFGFLSLKNILTQKLVNANFFQLNS
jgi:hypothetical protein